MAYEAGITKIILPEFDAMMDTPQNNPHHCFSVGDHTLKTMCAIESGKVQRLTMLLHDVGKPCSRTTDEKGIDHFKGHGPAGAELAEKIMRRLKLDNETIRKVTTLVRYHDWRIQPEEKEVRHAVNRIGTELFPVLLKVQNADMLAQSPEYMPQNLQRIIGVSGIYEKIIREAQCVSLKELQLSGGDIVALGCAPGPEVGRLLQKALEEVLDDPEKNSREYLLDFVRTQREVKE